MKWHFWNKTIFGKLALFLSTMFGVVLFSMSNLTGIRKDGPGVDNTIAIADSSVERFFIEELFLGEIKKPYSFMFVGLCVIGIVMTLVGWKRYSNRYPDGLYLYNIGTGYLATTMIGYGLTTMLLLKVFSWEVVPAFVLGVCLLALLIKNILHYRKHKRILKEEKKLTRVIITCIIALVLGVIEVVAFAQIHSKLKPMVMEDYRYRYKYSKTQSELMDQEINHRDYIICKYVNYFNPEGRQIDYETLKQEMESYKHDEASFNLYGWDNLWYCLEYLHYPKESYGTENVFSTINYGQEQPYDAFVVCVENKLQLDGIEPSEANEEQLDEACQYVYDIYTSQTPMVCLGDDEGELVIHFDVPESGNVDDITISWDGEGYWAYANNWYKVANVGDSYTKGTEPAITLEDGNIYYVRVRMKLAMPYYADEETGAPLVSVDGVNCVKIKTSEHSKDTVTAEIWVIPGQDN